MAALCVFWSNSLNWPKLNDVKRDVYRSPAEDTHAPCKKKINSYSKTFFNQYNSFSFHLNPFCLLLKRYSFLRTIVWSRVYVCIWTGVLVSIVRHTYQRHPQKYRSSRGMKEALTHQGPHNPWKVIHNFRTDNDKYNLT